MSRSVNNCSPWLREQVGDFYDARIKNSSPGSLSALRSMVTMLKSKKRCVVKVLQANKKNILQIYSGFVSLLSGHPSFFALYYPRCRETLLKYRLWYYYYYYYYGLKIMQSPTYNINEGFNIQLRKPYVLL
jgi:hypothetical protein